VKDDRHLEYWISQPVDVYLVIRQTDELSGQQVIRWMNVTRYLKTRKDKKSRQIIFDGAKLDMEACGRCATNSFQRPERNEDLTSTCETKPARLIGSAAESSTRCPLKNQ
jgi:hypothetical protein